MVKIKETEEQGVVAITIIASNPPSEVRAYLWQQ